MYLNCLIISTTIESVLNTLLYRSPQLKNVCRSLNGKILRIAFKECFIPLVLVFSERQLKVLGKWESEVDCSVTTHISVLLKLLEHKQQSKLFCTDNLKIEGDLQVIKNFVELASLSELEPTELLVPYIGDIASEGISKMFRGCSTFLRKIIRRHQQYIADILIEEWRVAPGTLETAWFAEKNAAIARAVEIFAKQLEKLEGN